MSEFTKLRWKYFWKQKWKEMKFAILPIWFGIIAFFIGLGIEYNSKWMIVTGIVFLSLAAIFLLIFLIKTFIKWIKSNWQKASERAINELNDISIKPDLEIEGNEI